jgi:hypothetical protein
LLHLGHLQMAAVNRVKNSATAAAAMAAAKAFRHRAMQRRRH